MSVHSHCPVPGTEGWRPQMAIIGSRLHRGRHHLGGEQPGGRGQMKSGSSCARGTPPELIKPELKVSEAPDLSGGQWEWGAAAGRSAWLGLRRPICPRREPPAPLVSPASCSPPPASVPAGDGSAVGTELSARLPSLFWSQSGPELVAWKRTRAGAVGGGGQWAVVTRAPTSAEGAESGRDSEGWARRQATAAKGTFGVCSSCGQEDGCHDCCSPGLRLGGEPRFLPSPGGGRKAWVYRFCVLLGGR